VGRPALSTAPLSARRCERSAARLRRGRKAQRTAEGPKTTSAARQAAGWTGAVTAACRRLRTGSWRAGGSQPSPSPECTGFEARPALVIFRGGAAQPVSFGSFLDKICYGRTPRPFSLTHGSGRTPTPSLSPPQRTYGRHVDVVAMHRPQPRRSRSGRCRPTTAAVTALARSGGRRGAVCLARLALPAVALLAVAALGLPAPPSRRRRLVHSAIVLRRAKAGGRAFVDQAGSRGRQGLGSHR
jgi:hypothetical protein